jgi:small-conductance mechanosensitive channel
VRLRSLIVRAAIWAGIALLFVALEGRGVPIYQITGGLSVSAVLALVAGIMAGYQLSVIGVSVSVRMRQGPDGEVTMLAGLLRVAAGIGVLAALLAAFGALNRVGAALGAFSGLLLGWSLQAPVSGMAAWVMISLKRPFRVGDRIQLPSLGLVGDVTNVNFMYTVLNQVGGAVGSEEAVGRAILIPNAMLFSNVVINYTARQHAAYILDEVVVRITYDTDWEAAERILLGAAREVTADIITATGQEPYVRADMYDYGIYMRLRFMTRATDRPRISYQIIKRLFQGFQRTAQVDFAIPYIYSFRKGVQASARYDSADTHGPTLDVPLSRVVLSPKDQEAIAHAGAEIDGLAAKIRTEGLIQPVIVEEDGLGTFQVVAGPLRVEACKRLGWRTIPAVVRGKHAPGAPAAMPVYPTPPLDGPTDLP